MLQPPKVQQRLHLHVFCLNYRAQIADYQPHSAAVLDGLRYKCVTFTAFTHDLWCRPATRLFCILFESRYLIEMPYEDTGRNRSRYLPRD